MLCNPRCNAGYVCVSRSGETYGVRPAGDAGSANVAADGAVDVAPEAATPRDPRPATERACPNGATLRVRLWDVHARPRRPDAMPWDGAPGLPVLLCPAGAAAVMYSLRGQA